MRKIIQTKSFKLSVVTEGRQTGKKMALLLPGRLDTKDYANFSSHAKLLKNLGYFTVTCDPPGTWESPGGIKLFTTTNYLLAVKELIEYFGNKPTVLLGHSRGASVAILAGNTNPLVTGIVCIMANFSTPTKPKKTSLEKGFELTYRDLPPGTKKTKIQKEFALPLEYWTDGEKYNPTSVLKKCSKPKLLIYGTNDSFTPPKSVEKLFQSIPKPKTLKKIACVHDYRYSPKAISEVNASLKQFLK